MVVTVVMMVVALVTMVIVEMVVVGDDDSDDDGHSASAAATTGAGDNDGNDHVGLLMMVHVGSLNINVYYDGSGDDNGDDIDETKENLSKDEEDSLPVTTVIETSH